MLESKAGKQTNAIHVVLNLIQKCNIKRPCTPVHRAFTLAEVLITLGIIGVVAAMTIPTLINDYEKKETVTALQKMYSTINQAVKISEIENGSMTGWGSPATDFDSTQSKDWWNTYFVPYSDLSVLKTCNSSNWADCWSSNAKVHVYLEAETYYMS